ncbi:MAG: branched-chain amino acid ABC transporter permease [Deltaproteobacteria bacterium]|nr:branched-chain amino acid ABC transporter permease [Deltaproteobacteria bacterium]MBW2343394.1 branched-chain amino acid ABC transporter permease [Deltaproteobacteria bacterium]
MKLQAILMQLLSGLSGGMLIYLIAVGLSLIFGTLRVLNLAHGAIYMLGAYLCVWLTSSFGHIIPGMFWWTLLLAPLLVALFGGLVEVLLLRRIYGWHFMYQFILTFALILIIGDIVRLVWGGGFYSITYPWPLAGTVKVAGGTFPLYNLFLVVIGVSIFAGLRALLHYTRLGKIIRGVTYNREIMNALGENVPAVYTMVFMLGCWLGGLAGALATPLVTVSLGMDMTVIIQCFIVVVIGGLGSLTGAFIGAIILGLLEAFGIMVIPQLAIAFGFILMAVVLIIRPYGLMGKREYE